jgi:AraC-like DNA-binding protein
MTPLLDRVLEGRRFIRAARHPGGLSCAARLVPPVQVACGYEDAYSVGAEILITTKNLAFEQGFEETEPGWGRLVFCVHLQGHRVVEVPSVGRYELTAPTFVAFYQAPGVAKRSRWLSGGKERSVMAGFAPSRPPVVGNKARSLAELISRRLRLEGQPFLWLDTPLDVQMEMVARALIAPGIHDDLLPTYLQLKAHELICLGLNKLLPETGPLGDSTPAETRADSRLARVCRRIEESVGEPPSVTSLADFVGMTPDRLSARFRTVYGVTVTEFITTSRMTRARLLLEQTDYRLKEIAFRAGYRHVSNFCIAYKRHFGLTPREARGRALGA